MYATKPLSAFKSHPETASRPPPEGRNSGYLVVKGPDDDGHDETCCWGTCGESRVWELPFPQNRVLTVQYVKKHGEQRRVYEHAYVFVPVPDQPLASNRYYAVVAKGRRKGLIRACSREEDMTQCCFCRCVKDVEPQPFYLGDVYQQVEIVQRRRGRFTERAVAADGFPYFLFRQKYWRVIASKPKNDFDLAEARGLDAALRSRQLSVDAGLLAGRWYCPFYLIREDGVAPTSDLPSSLVERFVLKRMDGSVAVAFDFLHLNKFK